MKNIDRKKDISSKIITIVMMFAGSLTFSSASYAYLDPGTGSIIVQSIIASVAAAFAAGSVFWHRLLAFFTGKSKSSDDTAMNGPDVIDSENDGS